jgi:hypothetical protein
MGRWAAVKTVAGKKIRWALARVGSIPTARTSRSAHVAKDNLCAWRRATLFLFRHLRIDAFHAFPFLDGFAFGVAVSAFLPLSAGASSSRSVFNAWLSVSSSALRVLISESIVLA